MNASSVLSAIVLRPEAVDSLAISQIPDLLGALEATRARLLIRMQAGDRGSDLLTARQVASRLHLTPAHVYELWRTNALPSVRIGRQVRMAERDLNAYLTRTSGQGHVPHVPASRA